MSEYWGLTDQPSPTITGHLTATRSPTGTQRVYLDAIARGEFVFRPCAQPRASRVAKSGLGAKFSPDLVNIDLAEAGILQGYPVGFTFGGKRNDQNLQVGNAVPPPVARSILKEFWND